jgi:hypothetical protein
MNESYIGDKESLEVCRRCQFFDKERRKKSCVSLPDRTGKTVELIMIYFVCFLLKDMQRHDLNTPDFRRLVTDARGIVDTIGEKCPKYFELNDFMNKYGGLHS